VAVPDLVAKFDGGVAGSGDLSAAFHEHCLQGNEEAFGWRQGSRCLHRPRRQRVPSLRCSLSAEPSVRALTDLVDYILSKVQLTSPPTPPSFPVSALCDPSSFVLGTWSNLILALSCFFKRIIKELVLKLVPDVSQVSLFSTSTT
jgi:hypothetical protein